MASLPLLACSRRHSLLFYFSLFVLFGSSLLLFGCPADNTDALKKENLQLKKQVSKLESVVFSLQEGNKAIQQQIDLLNREARKIQEESAQKLQTANEKIKHLSRSDKQDATHVEALEQENQKLRRDAKWLRTLREKWRKGLSVQQEGGKTKTINHPFSTVVDVTQATLVKNGYTILAQMKTDLKTVYLTDRKVSIPSSLELTGFRNQYLLTIEKVSPKESSIWVKADFEKTSSTAHILKADTSEIAEIEYRLIQKIQQTLKGPNPSKGHPSKE